MPKNVTVNSSIYIEVLRNHMLTSFNEHNALFSCMTGPAHKAKKVSYFLPENNVQVLDWPGNSPDLNPIENCWSFIKRKLQNCETSVPRLGEALQKMWENDLDREHFKKLSASIPKQLQMVIKAKCGVIKY